jgi:anti-anti-sigma regulatory factor
MTSHSPASDAANAGYPGERRPQDSLATDALAAEVLHTGTVQTDGVTILRLTGALDAGNAAALGGAVSRQLAAARLLGQGLVLDLAGVVKFGAAAAGALADVARARGDVPLAAAAPDAPIHAALRRTLPLGIALHTTEEEAVASLARRRAGQPPAPSAGRPQHAARDEAEPGDTVGPVDTASSADMTGLTVSTGPAASAEAFDELRQEIYGLRARARSRGLIDVAQGIVLARYRLPGVRAAFTLLVETSQTRNVPLRVLASAVVTAPVPSGPGLWFPARRQAPPPPVAFLTAHGVDARQRARALQAAAQEAATVTGADAAVLHLADPGRGHALLLESQHGHSTAYLDAYAHLRGGASAAAKAHATAEPVIDTEAAASFTGDSAADNPTPLDSGSHTVHAVPLITPDELSIGALSVQHTRFDARTTPAERSALLRLAADIAAWYSWYQRAVVLDALEHLHTRATTHHNP